MGTPELAVALFSSLRLPASHATALCLTHSAYTCPIKSPHLFAVPRLLSSAMAADPPQAMTVGSSLIQRYYQCLAHEPESLPELFHADACLQHSIGSEEATVHEGKEAINKFFLDLPYSAVALNVEDGAVDAQACGKNIIIMLTGLIGYNGAPATMRFAHTLMVSEVLTATGVSYSIKADIFRAYAAPLPPKAAPPAVPAVATQPLPKAAPAPAPAPVPEPEPEPEVFAEPPAEEAVAPAPAAPADEVVPAAAKKTAKPAAKGKGKGKAEAKGEGKGRGRPRGKGKGKAAQETKAAVPAPAPAPEAEAAPAPVESQPAVAKAPMSYASAAKASGDAPAPAPAPKPTRARGQGKARAAAAKAPPAAPVAAESAPDAAGDKTADKEGAWAKSKPAGARRERGSGGGRRGLQAAGSVRLSGDLSDIKPDNIKSVLKKFGTIAGLSANTMSKDYVFVDFTTQEAVAKAASAGTVTIGAVTLDVQVNKNFVADRAVRGGSGRRSPKRGGRGGAKRAAPAAAM